MENEPKQLTEEELLARHEAWEEFYLEPYLERLRKVVLSPWKENDLGGIAVDIAEAWMATNCPHDDDFQREIKYILALILRLTRMLKKEVGYGKWCQIHLAIDKKYYPDDGVTCVLSPLIGIMLDFCWAWLVSYRPCYRDPGRPTVSQREKRLESVPVSEEVKKRERRRIEMEKNCPYDPARVSEQKFADLIFLESLGSELDDPKEIVRPVGVRLGQKIFDAYPECGSVEEYCCVIVRVCEGIRNILMRAFADSKLMRIDKNTPMDLCGELQLRTLVEIISLSDR